nr:MAG TPA: hypothetical protein [Caudoviricetes sp.]
MPGGYVTSIHQNFCRKCQFFSDYSQNFVNFACLRGKNGRKNFHNQ